LSLVIAAATIGERLGVIDNRMSGALILVAVITSIITPMGFKKLFIKKPVKDTKRKIVFVGATQMTLPVTLNLNREQYDVRVFHVFREDAEEKFSDSVFEIQLLPNYDEETLRSHAVFETDIIVVATGDEKLNSQIAHAAKENGVERVIASTGFLSEVNELNDEGIETFSIPLSGQMLLRAYIEAPEILNMLSGQDASLAQINMTNKTYDGVALRDFPFTGDLVFVRIFRGSDSIVPHGDTILKTNDRLIVSGSQTYTNDLRRQLEIY
jgi:CPA2 family monovalent cation:H+ antiporter-2